MPRSHGIQVQNKFIKGLITEATALNYPEDACTETYNCVFDHKGRVTRRLGIDLEGGHVNQTADMAGRVAVTYLWKNVGGNGDLSFVVVHAGATISFYKVVSSQSLSGGRHANTFVLTTFSSVAVETLRTLECQFAQGNGFLFVTHPNCEPFYISYDIVTDTFTATQINLQSRDFVGVVDSLSDSERPTSITELHRYNLANQGWTSKYVGTSSTSLLIALGSKVFTTQSTLFIKVGDRVRAYSRATPGPLGPDTATGNSMIGTVTAYSGTTLTVNVTKIQGSGTLSDWNIVEEPDNVEAWNLLYGNYPNNQDVWYVYKNTVGVFAPTTEFVNKFGGRLGLAPKGHFVLGVFNEDRAAASGLSTIPAVTTGTSRPTTCAFFAGRAFYAGIQFQGYNARIYFSQILDTVNKAGRCYQVNDPTSEELFDLLPSDGGFVDILEAGQILKMVPYLNSLIVICTNGVWSITGSQGLGFVATDFSVHKISAIPSTSANSLVDVDGVPIWWTSDGIFQITSDQQTGQFGVTNIVNDTILDFYQNIPIESRRFARGTYDPEDHKVHWVFKSTVSVSFSDKYIYDRALTLNLLSKAFYPWSFDATHGRVHGVVAVRAQGGTYTLANVSAASGANNVQAASGANQVIVFVAPSSDTGNSGTIVKYLCSFAPTGVNETANLTFAESFQTTYQDWATTTAGAVDYISYFVTGYRIHGEAMRKYQTNYVNFFSDADAEDTTFKVRGQWDFSTSGSSGRDSTVQVVSGLFKAKPKRLKIRGHGKSMQFRIESISGQPFSLIGWAAFETGNQWI